MAIITDQGQLQGTLRICASKHFYYETSAKKLHQFLFPLEHNHKKFSQWIIKKIAHYDFEEGYDFVPQTHSEKGIIDMSISLDMAKELARIERTEQGRKARHYFMKFDRQLTEQVTENIHLRDDDNALTHTFFKEAFSKRNEVFYQKVTQINQLAQSMKVSKQIAIVQTLDLVNLIKAIRQYQYIADLYVTQEHDVNPIWSNEIIEKIKRDTGTILLNEND